MCVRFSHKGTKTALAIWIASHMSYGLIIRVIEGNSRSLELTFTDLHDLVVFGSAFNLRFRAKCKGHGSLTLET